MVLWAAVVTADVIAQPVRALNSVADTDFVAFLTGGRLLGSEPRCLYCSSAQLDAQTAVLGHAPANGLDQFVNPPLAAFVMRPLTVLSAQTALLIWLAVSVLALVTAVAVVARRLLPHVRKQRLPLVIGVTVLPGMAASIAYGQWDALALLAAVVAVDRLQRGDSMVAGLLLACLAVKPQLMFLAVPALLFARSWRTLAGIAAGLAVWTASTVALIGADGATTWVRDVLPARVGEASKAVGVPGLMASLGFSDTAAFAGAAAMTAIAVILLWRRRAALQADPAMAAGLGITASVACSPHVFAGDVALMGVLLALEARHRPGPAWTAAVILGAATVLDSLWPAVHTQAIVVLVLLATRLASRPQGSATLRRAAERPASA